MHAVDALGGLRKLLALLSGPDAGIDEVRLVTCQRLVRRLCPHCAIADALPVKLARRAEALASAGGVSVSQLKPAWKRPVGCKQCRQTGYQRRLVLIEMLEVTRELRAAVLAGAQDAELRLLAISQGFATLAADGIRKAAEGLTTLDEVRRSLPELVAAFAQA